MGPAQPAARLGVRRQWEDRPPGERMHKVSDNPTGSRVLTRDRNMLHYIHAKRKRYEHQAGQRNPKGCAQAKETLLSPVGYSHPL